MLNLTIQPSVFENPFQRTLFRKRQKEGHWFKWAVALASYAFFQRTLFRKRQKASQELFLLIMFFQCVLSKNSLQKEIESGIVNCKVTHSNHILSVFQRTLFRKRQKGFLSQLFDDFLFNFQRTLFRKRQKGTLILLKPHSRF